MISKQHLSNKINKNLTLAHKLYIRIIYFRMLPAFHMNTVHLNRSQHVRSEFFIGADTVKYTYS